MSSQKHRHSVSLVTDLESLVAEIAPEPLWLVRPKWGRRYASQKMTPTAELVDLNSINLAKMQTFDTV